MQMHLISAPAFMEGFGSRQKRHSPTFYLPRELTVSKSVVILAILQAI